jgi:hypothetical protein
MFGYAESPMKVARVILGLVSFIVVWAAVTGLMVIPIHAVIPWRGPQVLGVHWAAIPASVVGVICGYRVYQWVSKDRIRKGT